MSLKFFFTICISIFLSAIAKANECQNLLGSPSLKISNPKISNDDYNQGIKRLHEEFKTKECSNSKDPCQSLHSLKESGLSDFFKEGLFIEKSSKPLKYVQTVANHQQRDEEFPHQLIIEKETTGPKHIQRIIRLDPKIGTLIIDIQNCSPKKMILISKMGKLPVSPQDCTSKNINSLKINTNLQTLATTFTWISPSETHNKFHKEYFLKYCNEFFPSSNNPTNQTPQSEPIYSAPL